MSHLRFSPRPIESTYLIHQAELRRLPPVRLHGADRRAVAGRPGATFLLNSPYGPERGLGPAPARGAAADHRQEAEVLRGRRARTWPARRGWAGASTRSCRPASSQSRASCRATRRSPKIKDAIRKTYGKRGETVVSRNFAAVDASLAALHEVTVPAQRRLAARTGGRRCRAHAPDFVQRVTAMMLDGKGDLLPVSAMPVDGTFPTGTTQYEKRSIAQEIPIWDPTICTQCGLCSLVCPHAAIRMKVYRARRDARRAGGLQGRALDAQGRRPAATACCTASRSRRTTAPAAASASTSARHAARRMVKHKAINMEPKLEHLEAERAQLRLLPDAARGATVDGQHRRCCKGSQLREPLFEFSGACAGCGETPYLKLLTQLFGDRLLVANATGCSSIYGGNLPTTPVVAERRRAGPGLGEHAVRGQRRVRPGHAAGGRCAARPGADAGAASCAREIGDELAAALLDSAAGHRRARSARSASA